LLKEWRPERDRTADAGLFRAGLAINQNCQK
jgi:hypothetical protein